MPQTKRGGANLKKQPATKKQRVTKKSAESNDNIAEDLIHVEHESNGVTNREKNNIYTIEELIESEAETPDKQLIFYARDLPALYKNKPVPVHMVNQEAVQGIKTGIASIGTQLQGLRERLFNFKKNMKAELDVMISVLTPVAEQNEAHSSDSEY